MGEKVNYSVLDVLGLRCLLDIQELEAVEYINLEFKEGFWVGNEFEIHQHLGATKALGLEKIFQREESKE